MKKLFAIVLSLTLVLSMATTAFAAEIPSSEAIETAEETITPRIYWHGTANLVTTQYNNITGSNNVFPDSPLITSDGNNAGDVYIKVLNGEGKQVGAIKTVSPGKSVRLDQIPAFSGQYTIQGKAVTADGTYTFSID